MSSAVYRDTLANLERLLAAEMAERQTLERQLEALQERFDSFFAETPVGLAIIDDEFRYLRINETLARMNGHPVEHHCGRTIYDIVPEIAEAVGPALRRCLQNGRAVTSVELAGRAGHGEPRDFLLSSIPLGGNRERPWGLSVVVLDVTAQKRAERALAAGEARHRMLVEETSDAVVVFDEAGTFTQVNRGACELFGYDREEMLGMNAAELIPEKERAAHPISFDDYLAGKTVRKRRRLRRKDGRLIEVEVVGAMVGEGQMQSIVRPVGGLAPRRNGNAAHEPAAFGDETPTAFKARMLKEISGALAMAAEALEQVSAGDRLSALNIGNGIDFYEEVRRFETELIRRALRQTAGKQKAAAQLLGINQTTLHAMIRRYKIDLNDLGA